MDRARRARRLGGRSLGLRLFIVVGLPLTALQVVSLRNVRSQLRTERTSQKMVDAVSVLNDVGRVLVPATVEQIGSDGLAQSDMLGVPRHVVSDLAGVEFNGIIQRNRTELDAALARVEQDTGSHVLSDGMTVSSHFSELRGQLATMRQDLDDGRADAAQVEALFVDLRAVVSEAVFSSFPSDDTAPELYRVREHGEELVNLLLATTGAATETSHTLARMDEGAAQLVATVDGRRREAIEQYRAHLDPQQMKAFDSALAAADLTRFDVLIPPIIDLFTTITDESAAQVASTQPGFYRSAAQLLLASVDELTALQRYAVAVLGSALQDVQAIGADARAEVVLATVVAGGLTLLTLGMLGLTLRAVLRPLRRLTATAMRVGAGEFPKESVPVTGPSDLRVLTRTFNDMVAMFANFEAQMRALADSDLDDPVLTEELPGAMGHALRDSIHRLTSVTARLQDSEAVASAIVDTAADAIWTIDPEGRIVRANASAEHLVGLDAAEQAGRHLSEFVETTAGERTVHRPDGADVPVLVSTSVVTIEPETLFTVFARDISERKQFENQLADQARRDGLTGLANRFAAFEGVELALQRSQRRAHAVGLLLIDIDGFKSVNDSDGHAAGDRVLREVARRLRATVRSGEMLARLGGDEFLVVVDDAGDEGAVPALGRRLIREIEQPYEDAGRMFALSASIGIAYGLYGEADAPELVRRADAALYYAKQLGRGRVEMFDAVRQRELGQRAELELALRNAVRQNELELHLQPIVNLLDDRPWGAEALVRWNRPGCDQVQPMQFIPIAEESSLILEIEAWVLYRACTILAGWQRDPETADLRMSVNISGRHLTEGDLVNEVAEILDRTGADARGLELELTETQLLADIEHGSRVLANLRDRGIQIAVDDFGTGYASMTYLRQLPVDTVKIDRFFVSRALLGSYDRTIIEVLLQLGHTLDLAIVAEGVETSDQLDFVSTRGCQRGQGFHLARPMPVAVAEEWFAAHRHAAVPRAHRAS